MAFSFVYFNDLSLHLSGNQLKGSLPGNLVISKSLKKLSLSHNYLSGEIPTAVLKHPWIKLDLSYNKFNGTLNILDGFRPSTNTTFFLRVNRLSGIHTLISFLILLPPVCLLLIHTLISIKQKQKQ